MEKKEKEEKLVEEEDTISFDAIKQIPPLPEDDEYDDVEKKSKKRIVVIGIIIGLLLIVGVILLFVFGVFDDGDDEENYEDDKSITNVVEEKTEEIKEEEKNVEEETGECIRKSNDKTSAVEKIVGNAYLLDTRYASYLFYNSKYDYSQISDFSKYYLAINAVRPSHDQMVEKYMCMDYEDGKFCQNYEVISYSDVKNKYKEMFGTECNVDQSNFDKLNGNVEAQLDKVNVMMGCPVNIKIDNDDVYLSHNCGGTSGAGIYEKYVYDYKTRGTTLEVYVAVSYWADTAEGKYGSVLYKDYENTKKYKDFTWKECVKMDDSNYDEFSKYKVIYEKNASGNYIFKSSERISSGK